MVAERAKLSASMRGKLSQSPGLASFLKLVMKRQILLCLGLATSFLPAGELPQLTEKPWLGQYAGYEKRSIRLLVNAKGELLLMPPNEKKGFASEFNAIKMVPLIEEISPDGRFFGKTAISDGWEAVTPAAVNPEQVSFKGTVEKGAKFEVNLEIAGDEIRGGGRVIEKGEYTRPLRFVMRIQFPNLYYKERDTEKLAEKMKKDRIDLLRMDGKKLKLDPMTPLNAETEEYSGPGISQARLELAAYKAVKIDLNAGTAGSFELWNRGEGALYEGFTLGWKHDEEKDPQGKARFSLKLR